MRMAPTCIVTARLGDRHCSADTAFCTAPTTFFLTRVLPQPKAIKTLNRELRCIGGAYTYLNIIKADWAVPHPPTPRRPVR
jgi:hypothetical protein